MSQSLISPATTSALLHATQNDSANAAGKLKDAGKDITKVEEAAKQFEAVFIAEMMKPMFEGLSTEAPFGGGKGEETFRSMLLQEYGKLISQTGSVGLSDQVKQQMIQMQEQANNAGQ